MDVKTNIPPKYSILYNYLLVYVQLVSYYIRKYHIIDIDLVINEKPSFIHEKETNT